MPYTRKLPSGKWQGIAVHPNGKQSTSTFPLKKEALAWATDQEAIWRHDRKHDPRAGEIRVGEWVKLWSAARVVERNTSDGNASHLRVHILPKWETWPLASIDRLDVGAWVKEMQKAGTQPPTIQKVVQLLSSILNAAMEVGRISANPCARQRVPKAPVGLARYFTEDEAARIAAEMTPRWALATDLDMHTGLRLGELLGLRAGAVDFARAEIHVVGVMTRHGWRPYPKSKKSHRTVPIPAHLLDALAPLVLGHPADALVFTAPEGGAMTDVAFRNRVWAPAIALAGACDRHRDEGKRVTGCRGCKLTDPRPDGRVRPCPEHRRAVAADAACKACAAVPQETPHTMRHTAASWLVMAGVDLYRVQALLGHESFATTQRYAHLAQDAGDVIRVAWKSLAARELHGHENGPTQ